MFLVHYLFELVRIQIRIKQSDPDSYRIEKHNRYPYQSEKHDPDRGSGSAKLFIFTGIFGVRGELKNQWMADCRLPRAFNPILL